MNAQDKIRDSHARMDKVITDIEDAARGLKEICARMEDDLEMLEATFDEIKQTKPFGVLFIPKEES